jgi:hypothetical protein
MSPLQRILLAAALVSGWLVCLLAGWSLGGAIHVALAAGLGVFPWRELRR